LRLFTSPRKLLEGFAVRHYLIATGIHVQSIWIRRRHSPCAVLPSPVL